MNFAQTIVLSLLVTTHICVAAAAVAAEPRL